MRHHPPTVQHMAVLTAIGFGAVRAVPTNFRIAGKIRTYRFMLGEHNVSQAIRMLCAHRLVRCYDRPGAAPRPRLTDAGKRYFNTEVAA